ncbi:MAG: abortive infection family protein [Collinsella aerofaciens]
MGHGKPPPRRCGKGYRTGRYSKPIVAPRARGKKLRRGGGGPQWLSHIVFSLERFQNDFYGLTPEEIKRRHGAVVEGAIAAINSVLFFGGHELRCFGNNYVIVSVDDVPEMSIPSINTIDRSYIKDMAERAQEDIELGNFDSALTKARTLLEEVFCWAIERKGMQPSSSGDAGKLFSQVKCLYNIHADRTMDRRICDLVNGLNKIVDSIGQMRNKQGDAHGVGASRVNIEDYHARLAVNAAANVADFVLSVVHRAERNGH